MEADQRLHSVCSRMAVEMAVLSRLDTPDMMSRTAALLCLPLSEGPTRTLDRVCTVLVRTQREAQKLTKPIETSELAERANMILSSALDGVMQFQSAASSSKEVAAGVQGLLLRACPSIRALVKWMTACAAKTRRAVRLLDTCSLEGVSDDHLALVADAADKCETCVTKVAPVAARLRRMHVSYSNLRKSLAAFPEALEALESLCSRCEVVHQTLCMLRQAQETSGKASKGAKKSPQHKFGAKATELAPSLAPAVVSLLRASSLPEQLDELQRSFTLARQALVSVGNLRQWREELNALAEPASRMAQLPSASVCDGAVDALCGALGLLGRGAKEALEHGDSDEDADPDEIRLTAAEIEIVKAERRGSVFKGKLPSGSSVGACTDHTSNHTESNEFAPAEALPIDEVSLDGLVQAQRRRVRSLKRAYTPSVERLSSSAAALLLALRKLDSADTAAQADLDLAYTNLTSPGAMEGVLATFRQAIKAVVRKAALLQQSRSSAVRMLGVRVKTQSYTSGKWADRLTSEAAAIAKRGIESAEKVSKGAEKLRAVRARLAQGRSLVEAALGLLMQVAGEDRGEAAELACEEAATRCEARIDPVRRATRILNKLTSFRLNGMFKPLVDCRDAASAVNDFALRLLPQLDAVMEACAAFEAENDGVLPARLDKALNTALQPLLSAPETTLLVSGYQESGSKLQALVKALEDGAAPIPEPTRFTDAAKLTTSLPAPSCCDDALFTLRAAMRSLRLPDVFMDLDNDPDQTPETTDGTPKPAVTHPSRRVAAERSESTAAATPLHALDVSAVTRAISEEVRLSERQIAPLTALLEERGARSVESFFERAREIATFWNCTSDLGNLALEEAPAFERSSSKGVCISRSRSLRSAQGARMARRRQESANDLNASCSSGMGGLGGVRGLSRPPEVRMSSVWRLLSVLGLNELTELSELSALLVGPAKAPTCDESNALTLDQLCLGLARVAASLVTGPKQNPNQHSVNLAASATETTGTGQVASNVTCADDDPSNAGEAAGRDIGNAAPEFAGDFVAQLGRLLGSIDRGLRMIDELERGAKPRYAEIRQWMSRNLDSWLTLLQPLRDAQGAIPREKVELLCNYGRVLRSALRGGAATEIVAATSERGDRPQLVRKMSVASVRGRDGGASQVTMLRVTCASARLVVSEVLEEVAMMAAAEMADLSPGHALRKQWNPLFARNSISLKLILCCLRPPELPSALSRTLRVLFAHFCSYSWHASDGAPSAATLRLRRRGWHALVDAMEMTDGASAALAFNCHRVAHGMAEHLLEDGFYSAMLLLASARLLEDGGRMPDETTLRAKGGLEPLLLSLVSDVLWAQVAPLQRKLGLVDVEGAELSLRFVQERPDAFALLFHAYSEPVPEDADAERSDASGAESTGAAGTRAENAVRGASEHAKGQSQQSRAHHQESVRRLQLQQLQQLHQQNYARTSPRDSAGQPSTPSQVVQGTPSSYEESSAEHRRVGLASLVALERHFLLQPRIGYSADRLRTLHNAQFRSAPLSLLQLAVLLKDIDDVPKSSIAHRSAASEPRAFRIVCSHALEALRTRLLAFERKLPVRYADAVPPPLQNATIPDDLRLLHMPETAISSSIEDLLRDPSLERSTRSSQHAWACASFPCLMSEELAPPPCTPAVLHLVHTAQLVIMGQARVANTTCALKEALATLMRARASHAAELPNDRPFPPADAVFFACLASKACLAEGEVGPALRHAASAWRIAKMSCDRAEAHALTARDADSHALALAAARSVLASAFGHLGTVCYHLHRFDLASALFLRALEPRSVGGACNTLDLVLSLNNLAAAVECSPRPRLAFELYTQAHALLVAHAGLAHPRAVILLRNLGRASWKRGHKGISAETTAASALRFGGGLGVGDAIGATTAQELLKRSGNAKLIVRPRSAEPMREKVPMFPLSPPLRRQVRKVA